MSKKGRRPDSTSSRSPYASHPGYDSDYRPQYDPVPRRVKSAAEGNYIQGQGTMNLFLNHSHPKNAGYESERPLPKARTDAAMNILNRSINGTVGSMLGKSRNHDDDDDGCGQCQQRVKGAAIAIAEQHRGQMDNLIGSGSRYVPGPALSRLPVPRIKRPALDTAEMHRGGATALLFHSYGKLEPNAAPPPRVKASAEDNYNKAAGNVGRLFHGDLTPSARPQPRVKPKGEENADKHRGCMHNLMRNAGYTPKGYSHYNRSSLTSGGTSGRASGRSSSSMM